MDDLPDTGDEDDGRTDVGSTSVHQPGYDPADAPTPTPGRDDPPDAVGPTDDQGGGPEDRAPEPPDAAR